jgi:hypothetical protein
MRHRALIISAAAAVAAVAVAASVALACASVPDKKVAVCKYVGKPGVNEVLTPGENPILVSISALVGPAGDEPSLGQQFSDAQGRSVVVALPGMPVPAQGSCAPPSEPESVVPTEPVITPATCESGATLTMPAETDGIAYTAEGGLTGPSVVVVTATAKDGYMLAATEPWQVTEDSKQATLTIELAGPLTTNCGGGEGPGGGDNPGGGDHPNGGVKGETTQPPPVTGSPDPRTAFTL